MGKLKEPTADEASAVRQVPPERTVRDAVRRAAAGRATGVGRAGPMTRGELELAGREVLASLSLPECYLGFAMVAVDNELWREQFEAVPMSGRLLLLPHCLRDSEHCQGTYDAVGLHCAACGRCELPGLTEEAEKLGYRVLVAEGSPAVVQHVLRGKVDAVLGVACLESLEKAFEHITDLGIPHAAVPLLRDGCEDTEAELDIVRALMRQSSGRARENMPGYIPLLRSAAEMFEEETLAELLEPVTRSGVRGFSESFAETADVSLDWLGAGGKRFRPFVTLASYAAMTEGAAALDAGADLEGVFGDSVKRVALAIEVMHKASLVHDDIEDGDATRYGGGTVHMRHGVPVAVNVGDYLIGLGYRLVASGGSDLGGECVAEILAALSEAHLKLCVGQGAELAERRRSPDQWQAETMQAVYALKTAPAFEVAFYAGLRMAGEAVQYREPLKSYSRQLGVAYQVRNDLEDYEGTSAARTLERTEAWMSRPTILRAFAGSEARKRLSRIEASEMPSAAKLAAVRGIYEEHGVFESARRMISGCHERALRHADAIGHDVLSELMRFVANTVL